MDKNVQSKFDRLIVCFENSPLPFAILTPDFSFYFSNKAFKESFGDLVCFSSMIGVISDAAAVKNQVKVSGSYVFNYRGSKLIFNGLFDDEGEIFGFSVSAEKNFASLSETNLIKAQSINHEIHDRLNMIFSCIYAISQTDELNYAPSTFEYFNIINQNCFQLLRASNNLSTFLRIAEQDDHSSLKVFNASSFLKKLVDTIVLMDNQNRVSISADITEQILPIKADISKLEFVIVNIILNAIKYTREGNRICVSLSKTNKNAVISIADSGAGIPKDVLSRVGDAFFTYSHDGKFECGFGLGIYICKKYISEFGGSFAIQSEQGKGTTVTVSIPLHVSESGDIAEFNSPPDFRPDDKFSQTQVQLSEFCFYPEL